MTICTQDGILLLHAKPGILVLHHRHHLLTFDAEVGFCRKYGFVFVSYKLYSMLNTLPKMTSSTHAPRNVVDL